eukprot:TRINITY_DN630_c2_g2_i1.p1 TRINITY_DN630_c2_g2~~TRINITY_DN630_c2_g2_i1.p1  ORF type:complete len:340 (+),score=53.56 TRINITY_DN630_c2_g2_i1:99-1118(+)
MSASTAPAELPRLMVCADGHDVCTAGVGYAIKIIQLIEKTSTSDPYSPPEVIVFGHVHNDSKIPLLKTMGKIIGVRTTTKEERKRDLEQRGNDITAELKQTCKLDTITLQVDDSESNMVQAYSTVVIQHRPDILIINERKDYSEIMKPFWKEVHKLSRATPSPIVLVARKEIVKGKTVHLLLVSDDYKESSQRVVSQASYIISPDDAVYILSCWELPDFATAMYADDHRWHVETKKCEKKAKAAVQKAAADLQSCIPALPPTHLSLHTKNERVANAVSAFHQSHVFNHILVGGSSTTLHPTSSKRSSSFSFIGDAKRSIFGTTADSLLPHNPGAVSIIY